MSIQIPNSRDRSQNLRRRKDLIDDARPVQAQEITQHLNSWRQGDSQALDAVMPVIYAELRRLASVYMRGERPGHMLQTTALVHEAFVRLSGHRRLQWRSRTHFLANAATSMRRILVDHARHRDSIKRGGELTSVALEEACDLAIDSAPQFLALDEALKRLATIDPQQGRLVELRYFGGMTAEEIAEVLGVTDRTVKRRWRTARMWLYRYLSGESDGA